jgi:hypothetical protein
MESFAALQEITGDWTARPAGIVLEGILGSRAYGLADENSDVDRRGVFLAPSEEFFGLDDVRETADNPYADEVLFELGRFIRQALKANPNMIELLWLDKYEVCTEIGMGLIGLRTELLGGARVRSSYLGTAHALLGDVRRGGPKTAKTARHLARLLITGYGLWYSGKLQVELPDPQFVHDFGQRVAQDGVGHAEVLVAQYEKMFEETETVLPAMANRERADAWLKETRAAALSVKLG